MTSNWSDESLDSASTNGITSVTYQILDGSGNAYGAPVTVAKGGKGRVRVPAGTYTIRQISYTLANGAVVNTVAPASGETNKYQFAAYAVTNNKNSSGGTYTVTVGAGTTAPVEVKFTNTRNQFQTTVRTEWLPVGHVLQYTGDIPYELSYTTLKSDGTLEAQAIPGKNAASDWSAQHSHIPSHGVNGQPTVCNVASDTVEALAAKYNTSIESKIEGGNYIFTIINTLRQGDIILHKDWEYEHNETEVKVLVKGYGLTQAEGYTLPEAYEAFNTGEGGGIIVTLNEENGWTHIVRGYKDYKYTVEEIDPSGDIAQYVVRRYWMSGDDQDTAASFVPPTITGSIEGNTDSGLQEAGAEVFITNVQPICKIVDQNGVEHPFHLLNSAVKYARDHKATLPMDADNPVRIQMLVDYVIPSTDKVTLDRNTDNNIITTAATSGGIYNFTPTFDSTQGRSDEDSKSVAILARGWNQSGDAQALFYVNSDSAKLKTADITLDGAYNTANHTGRAVYVNKGDVCFTGGTTVRNFHTKAAGGAVYVGNGGNHTLIDNSSNGNVVFSNCGNEISSSNDDGAAICIQSGNLIINNSGAGTVLFEKITGNKDADGGAIGVNSSNSITLNNTSTGTIRFEDCTACYGGAMETDSGSVTLNNSGTGTMEFLRCYTDYAYEGGAIYCKTFTAVNNGTITFTGTIGTDAEAKTKTTTGGAIYASSTVSITGNGQTSFTGCKASGSGGAIYAGGASTLENVSFTNCIGNNGGGVYGNSTVSVTNTKPAIYPTVAGGFGTGGASAEKLYKFDGTEYAQSEDIKLKMLVDQVQTANVSFGTARKMTFTTAETTTEGNSYMAANGDTYVFTTERTSDTSRAQLTKNGAFSMFTFSENAPLIVENLIMIGGGSNTRTNVGGAIYLKTQANSLTVSGSSFENCGVNESGTVKNHEGGAIYAKSNQITVQKSTAPDTSKSIGTAAGKTAGTEIRTTFNTCKAQTNYGGGAIWTNANTGTASFTDSDFTDCDAHSGGGVYFSTGNGTSFDVEFKRCNFTGCDALNNSGYGGAFCQVYGSSGPYSKETTVEGCTFTNCTAKTYAGAIIVRALTAKVSGSTFTAQEFT